MSTITASRGEIMKQNNSMQRQINKDGDKNKRDEQNCINLQVGYVKDQSVDTLQKNENESNIQTLTKTDEQNIDRQVQQKQKKSQQNPLIHLQSIQELTFDFQQNKKILSNLSFNIDDLFKKINLLTQEVQNQISGKPLYKNKSIAKNQKKSQSPPYKSQKLIHFVQPVVLHRFSSCQQSITSQNQGMFSMKMFQIGKSLGYGKFGEVLLCRHKQTGCLYALKKIFKSTIQQYRMCDQLLIQLQSCKRMKHPNIIRSYASFTDTYHIFIISQYISGSILTKKFKSCEEETIKIIVQVLYALKFMHENGVVHRDLKPENIIIEDSGVIKICDFGWAGLIQQEQKMNIICGTLDYVSPEMVTNREYTKEVDLWSLGVLTYELLFGSAPFKAQNRQLTFEKVKKFQFNFPEYLTFSPACIDFINRLLKPETQRMSLQQCFEHPFIKDSQVEQNYSNEFTKLLE